MIDPEKEELFKRLAKVDKSEHFWDNDAEITEESLIEAISGLVSKNEEDFARRDFRMSVDGDFALSYLSNNQKEIIKMIGRGGTGVDIRYKEWYSFYFDPMDNEDISEAVAELKKEEIEIYAKIFWDNFVYPLSDADNDSHTFESKIFNSHSSESLSVEKGIAREIYSDVMTAYLEEKFKKEPDKMNGIFFEDIRNEFDRGNELIAILENMNSNQITNLAIEFYVADEDGISEFVTNLILGDETESEESPEVIITIPREVIVKWGINKGTFYENAPWNLVRLEIGHLRKEGRVMRHCVGYEDYAMRVFNNEIEIWSLRSKDGSPRFTFEVDFLWNKLKDPKARAIHFSQIKGKTNRLAGRESPRSKEIKFPDEVVFLFNLLSDMGVDPREINDLMDQVREMYPK